MAGLIFLWQNAPSTLINTDPSLYPASAVALLDSSVGFVDVDIIVADVLVDVSVGTVELEPPVDIISDITNTTFTNSTTTYDATNVQYDSTTVKYGGEDIAVDPPPQVIRVGGI